MKYLCLCYYDIEAFERLEPSQVAELEPACRPHDQALRSTGKLTAQGSLSLPGSWAYFVPGRQGPRQFSGPYTEGKDQAGAFFILEADSFEEACEAASKHAAANYGEHLGFAVEVRACEAYEAY